MVTLRSGGRVAQEIIYDVETIDYGIGEDKRKRKWRSAEESVSKATSRIVVKFRDYFGVDPTLPIQVFRERASVQDEGLRQRAKDAGVSIDKQYQKEYYERRKAVLQEIAKNRMRQKRMPSRKLCNEGSEWAEMES